MTQQNQNQPGGPNDYVMQGQAWQAGQRAQQPWNARYLNQIGVGPTQDPRRAARRRERRRVRRVASGLWLLGEILIFAIAGATIKWVKTPSVHPSHGAGAVAFVAAVFLWTAICIAASVGFLRHSRRRPAQ
ncbi:MAG: hypothetical protein ACYCST_18060 [Acidimicrobiales bacterium]